MGGFMLFSCFNGILGLVWLIVFILFVRWLHGIRKAFDRVMGRVGRTEHLSL